MLTVISHQKFLALATNRDEMIAAVWHKKEKGEREVFINYDKMLLGLYNNGTNLLKLILKQQLLLGYTISKFNHNKIFEIC